MRYKTSNENPDGGVMTVIKVDGKPLAAYHITYSSKLERNVIDLMPYGPGDHEAYVDSKVLSVVIPEVEGV